jgi:hypothetical protein
MRNTVMTRFFAALCALFLIVSPAMAVEEPPFRSEFKDGAFEVRLYGAMIAAEVDVAGDRGEAANRGFRPLANYIFGDNQPKQKIAMTAPVTQTKGEQIAMTAPVTQTRDGPAWRVRFIMPVGYTMETLPKPTDPNVRLVEMPAQRFAVMRFSGFAPQSKLDERERALRAFLAQRNLTPIGAVHYAFYDPPWTPPFLRRNEVMIPIAP